MTNSNTPTSPGAQRAVHALVESLRLAPTGPDRYRGHTIDIGSRAVYGGHVLAQTLMAAADGVAAGHRPHSLHAYFLLAGDKQAPIDYDVERTRDGGSFSTRRVKAEQHGRVIFEMSASFHRDEPGPEHASAMPNAPDPESLVDDAELKLREIDHLPPAMQAYVKGDRAIEFRPCEPQSFFSPQPRPSRALTWLRIAAPLPDEPLLHQALLAYASDWSLLGSALRPHGLSFVQPRVMAMSLDHALWFHRPFRADEWLLYESDSPSAAGARGFCRGSLYDRAGRLVASTAQEGLVRVKAAP